VHVRKWFGNCSETLILNKAASNILWIPYSLVQTQLLNKFHTWGPAARLPVVGKTPHVNWAQKLWRTVVFWEVEINSLKYGVTLIAISCRNTNMAWLPVAEINSTGALACKPCKIKLQQPSFHLQWNIRPIQVPRKYKKAMRHEWRH
jgi:hypothetical protein